MSSSDKSIGQEIKAAMVRSEPSVEIDQYNEPHATEKDEFADGSHRTQNTRLLVSFSIASKPCWIAMFSSCNPRVIAKRIASARTTLA
jgi:hypothetical protein